MINKVQPPTRSDRSGLLNYNTQGTRERALNSRGTLATRWSVAVWGPRLTHSSLTRSVSLRSPLDRVMGCSAGSSLVLLITPHSLCSLFTADSYPPEEGLSLFRKYTSGSARHTSILSEGNSLAQGANQRYNA